MNEDEARLVATDFARDFTKWIEGETSIEDWDQHGAEDELQKRVLKLLLGDPER